MAKYPTDDLTGYTNKKLDEILSDNGAWRGGYNPDTGREVDLDAAQQQRGMNANTEMDNAGSNWLKDQKFNAIKQGSESGWHPDDDPFLPPENRNNKPMAKDYTQSDIDKYLKG